MAVDYHKVLRDLGATTTVIGRGEASARRFETQTGQPVVAGGLEAHLAAMPSLPDAAIVATGVEALAPTARRLVAAGVRRLLLEKPGALTRSELDALASQAGAAGAEIVIAYNRRMYASTLAAQRMIEEDGGVRSVHFEFTEWSHVIEGLPKAPGVKEAWLLGNSTHVIDLAFHLSGAPVDLSTFTAGSLPWHPAAAAFSGAGRTEQGALFSYCANWDAPGRWSVEVLTRERRLIFRPMESLQVMRRGSVAIEPVPLDDAGDKAFKPGLHEQVCRFLRGRRDGLCSLAEQVRCWPLYERIAGYESR
jgi:predicted dehydrogenase